MNEPTDSSGEDSVNSDVVFPEDFPLDPNVYDEVEFDGYWPSSPLKADVNDPRRRDFDSLYPLELLVLNPLAGPSGPAAPTPFRPPRIGRLRRRWQQAFQKTTNGAWNYVEYVPAWCDPDWSARYTYTTDPAAAADMDALDRQYAKPGMLQTQRPALRPEDNALSITATAKRWGIYPWQNWAGLEDRLQLRGWSGVTPRAARFPTIPLSRTIFSPEKGMMVDVLTVEDLAFERQRLEAWRKTGGLATTDEDFWQALRKRASDSDAGPIETEKAAAFLALAEALDRIEERAEYQRLLFSGSTSNELVEQNAWTQGADAFTDLATPLHDLVLRNKWTRTERWGTKEGQPRVVYNLSGRQGEYTAHDEIFWSALQPSLQLVSQVLNSQHPATLVWGDVRKLRPVVDAFRRVTNSKLAWRFCTSSDHAVDVEGLTGVAKQWREFVAICESGFDTTGYACEILNRTVEWSIKPQYRVTPSSNGRSYGSTGVRRLNAGSPAPPFKIRINLAADMFWPLLVDEYSNAEKAASTLIVAATMLHELSHALVVARSQMFMPSVTGASGENIAPLWLQLKPSWQQEIAEFSRQRGVDILDSLQKFGSRMEYDEERANDEQVFWATDEVYWAQEPDNEEGWATENQYFGGILQTLPTGSVETLPGLESFRFLEDASHIAAIRGWGTDNGFPGRFELFGALAMPEYQKLLSQEWWDSDFALYGPSAMKINNASSSIRGVLNLTILDTKSVWPFVGKRYGRDARKWLSTVFRRMKHETENKLLWQYLFYQTIVATEAEACEKVWFTMQENWDVADVAVWNDRSAARARGDELCAVLDNVTDLKTDTVNDLTSELPVAEFQRLFAAFWHVQSVMSREATYNQNVAMRFITLQGNEAKDKLFGLYSERIRSRMMNLFMSIIDDMIQALAELRDMATSNPNILRWLTSRPEIARIFDRDIDELDAKMRTNLQHFAVVCDVFSPNSAERASAVNSLGAIPSAAAQTLAERIKRLAMRQYNALEPTDPCKRIADDWQAILRDGDLLRSPASNSPAAQYNQQLRTSVENINAGVAAHQMAVANSHPDPKTLRKIADTPPLLHPQPSAVAGRPGGDRILTAQQQQTFTAAAGFHPYRDTTTGFTRFADVRAQQPDLQQHLNASMTLPEQQSQQPYQDPKTYLNFLDRRIENSATELQQMARWQGQPANMVAPQSTTFGAAAAQQGQALQQIEGLIGQRVSTQQFIESGNALGQGTSGGPSAAEWASYTPAQQQQFFDEQAWWQQSYGT